MIAFYVTWDLLDRNNTTKSPGLCDRDVAKQNVMGTNKKRVEEKDEERKNKLSALGSDTEP